VRGLWILVLVGCVEQGPATSAVRPSPDRAGPEAQQAEDRARSSIVDGETAKISDYPVTGVVTSASQMRCTGTLIAPDVVLTAAHCLHPPAFGYLGFTLDADLNDGAEGIVKALVTHKHPDYVPTRELTDLGARNDIGLVILERPYEIDAAFETIDAAVTPDSVPDLGLCGYGRETWAVVMAGKKRTARVEVERMAELELATPPDGPQPCSGDSGAPLFAELGGSRTIVGVVSRAVGSSVMCNTGAIVTRTGPYAAWIAEASQDRDLGCGGAAILPITWLPWRRRRRRR
jgi:secreted trypsin-like serine protease